MDRCVEAKAIHHIQSINPKILFAAMPPSPERKELFQQLTLVGTAAHGSVIDENLQQFNSDTFCSTNSHSSAPRTLSPICNCSPAPTYPRPRTGEVKWLGIWSFLSGTGEITAYYNIIGQNICFANGRWVNTSNLSWLQQVFVVPVLSNLSR